MFLVVSKYKNGGNAGQTDVEKIEKDFPRIIFIITQLFILITILNQTLSNKNDEPERKNKKRRAGF